MFFQKKNRHSSIHRLAGQIRVIGNVCLWGQLVLGLVPAIVWLVILLNQSRTLGRSGISWLMGSLSILALIFSILWWFRNQQLARRLRKPNHRLRREGLQQSLEAGLVVNLFGMVVLMIAGLSYGWVLMAKVLTTTPQFTLTTSRPSIVPIDIMALLIIIHTVAAELVGVLGYLWLANQVDNYEGEFTPLLEEASSNS
ncbi:MAG: DUF3611 family protein [Cyanobacteria bacterium]|nr:DUF3611 family protein [Cyanobacteriota bacterium]MDW8200163.1 DUF3611 family protein [Cyanobacteriota bacterium SKYGB_h_bin112]